MFLPFVTQLHIWDTLLCVFVFLPCHVLYWRGAWDLVGLYIDAQPVYPVPRWVLLVVSLLAYTGYYVAPLLDWKLSKKRSLSYFVASRVYMWLNGVLCMCYWRALWETLDYFLASSLSGCVLLCVISYVQLILLRSARTCIFAPFYVALDTRDDILRCSTRFQTTPFTWRYILDSLLSHFVILGLVICSWSGLFNVIGYMVFPDNTLLSDIVCLLVGLFLAILLLLLEELFARVTVALEKEAFTYKLLFEDFCYLLIFVANVVLWRGAWRLVARYIIADVEMGGWICFAVGSVCLTFLQVFSYVGRHDVVLDGGDVGRDAFYPTYYLRHYLLCDYDYYEYGSNKSGTRTPPFPLDNSSFSYLSGSQCTVYDNIGHTNRLSVASSSGARPVAV